MSHTDTGVNHRGKNMTCITNYNLCIIAGDYREMTFRYKDSTNNPFDLTDMTFKFVCENEVFNKDNEVYTDPLTGEFTFIFNPEDTDCILESFGRLSYRYGVIAYDINDNPTTLFKGNLHIESITGKEGLCPQIP